MDDPVVAEYDVVLVRPAGGSELSLVQFPTRPEFRRAAFASPTGAQVRPRHQMLTLAYTGLQDSASVDVPAPIVKMRSSRAKLPTRGGLAYVHGGTVHLFPVRNVLQMRPDFSAIDAADEQLLNAEVKRKEEVKEEEAVTEVKQTYKKAESQQSGARRLRSYKFKIEEEDKDHWVELEVPLGDRDAGAAAPARGDGGDALWARGGVHALRWDSEGEGGEGQTKRDVVDFESSWERYLTPTAAAAVPAAARAESGGDDDAASHAPGHDAIRRVEGLLASSMRGIQTVSMRAWGTPTLELHAWRGLPPLAQMHAIVMHSRVVRFATLKRLVTQLSFTCGSSAAVRSISARRPRGGAAGGAAGGDGEGGADADDAMDVETGGAGAREGGADLDPANVGGDAALIAMLRQVADLVQGCWVIKSALAPTVRRAPTRSDAGEGNARESGAVADARSAVRKRLGSAATGAAGSFVERVERDAEGLPWSVVAPLDLNTLRNAAVRDRVLLEYVRRGAVARGAGRVKEEVGRGSGASTTHIHRRDLQAVVQPLGVGRTALIAQLKSVASLKHRETGAGASANWVFELARDDEFIAAHRDVVTAHRAEWERRAASIDAMLRATCPAGAGGAAAAAAAPSVAASGAGRAAAASLETSRSDIALAISLALRNSSGKPTPIVETVGRVAAAALAQQGVLQRGALLHHVEAHDEVLSVAKSLVRAGDTAALIRAALASLLDSDRAALVIPVGGAPTRGGAGAQRYALHNERTNARNASDRALRTVVAALFSGVGGATMSVKKKDIVAAVEKAHGASVTMTTAAYNRVMKEFATSEKNSWTLKVGDRL